MLNKHSIKQKVFGKEGDRKEREMKEGCGKVGRDSGTEPPLSMGWALSTT